MWLAGARRAVDGFGLSAKVALLSWLLGARNVLVLAHRLETSEWI